jgi:hypothetical protein
METTTATAEVKIGSIFASSWGYDQTNVNFYRVVRCTAKTVTLQEVQNKYVESGDMVGKVIPSDIPKGATFRRTVKYYSAPSVAIEDFAHAYLWHGRPMDVSSYA